MAFDFDLKAPCNHIVDGIQYWGFDLTTPEQAKKINDDITFRQNFLKRMAYKICPRCNGKGWYWDIQFTQPDILSNAEAQPVLIRYRAKLKQELTKFLSTIMGDNIFHLYYGVQYSSFIGRKIAPDTPESLQMTTAYSLDYLRSLHFQQSTYQKLDEGEMIDSLGDMQVDYDPGAPTSFYITATIITNDGDTITTDYTVKNDPIGQQPNIGSDVATFFKVG